MVDISQRSPGFHPSNLIYERKLDIALRSSHAIHVQKELLNEESKSYDILLLRKHCSSLAVEINDLIPNVNIFPDVFLEILALTKINTKYSEQKLVNSITRAFAIQEKAGFEHVSESFRSSLSDYVSDVFENLRHNPEIDKLSYAMSVLTKIVDKTAAINSIPIVQSDIDDSIEKRARKARVLWKSLNMILCWSQNSVLISFKNKWYLLPKAYILLMHNKVSDILSVMVLASSYPDQIYNCNTANVTMRWIIEWAHLAKEHQNNFFKISKVLESLVIGMTLIREEGSGNRAFFDQICASLMEDINFDFEYSRLYGIMDDVSTPLLHELGCLSKIMGHPFCDMDKTQQDLYEKTHEDRPINVSLVQESIRTAKRDFIEGYMRKKKSFPPCTIHTDNLSLLRARQLNVNPFSETHQSKYGIVPLTAMDDITLQKVEEFDKIDNFLSHVKDRTVSLVKRIVESKYIKGENTKIDQKETRALLAYLFLPYESTEHLSYLELYSNDDWDLMEQYLVTRLVPKEKEHKEKGRCFGCKPPCERARTIVINENVAHYLHMYSDSEAMTLSELSLIKKLYAFRNMYRAYQGYSQLTICLDASGWNSRQRAVANVPVAAATADKVFGTNMISKTHIAYHHMFLYLPDVDKTYHWQGQAGGIEGLDQYYWVLSYIAQLKTVLRRLGYAFRLMVKGDDARIVLLIPPQILETRTLDSIRTEVVKLITEDCEKFGHVMKPEDSYGSTVYTAFSKNAFIKNVEMPQSYRKAQKAYGANNAFLTTLDDYASSAFSNCHSASKTSPSPVSCYFLALWWFVKTLMTHPMYKEEKESVITALCLLPNMLGGFPVIYLHNFYQRAESDLLSSYIGLYCAAYRVDYEVYQVLDNAMHQRVLDPKECILMLCIDPYSLPLYKPTTAASVLKQSIRDIIKDRTVNEDIKTLFETKDGGFQDILMLMLASSNVYSPKIMNGLFNCSPEGIIGEIVAKFESGKSIYNSLILQGNRRIGVHALRKAFQADKALHVFRIKLMEGRLHDSQHLGVNPRLCPGYSAQKLRDKLWKKKVEGVTQPPVWHMVKVGQISKFSGDTRADLNHFNFIVSYPKKIESRKTLLFSTGDYDPFMGDSTGKGLTSPEVSLTTKNIFSLKIANLIDLYRWVCPIAQDAVPEDRYGYHQIVEAMVYNYTGRRIREFLPFSPNRPMGRTIQHHVRSNQYRPSIVPNTLQNAYTWVKYDLLAHHMLSNSMHHYHFNYYEILCWTLSVVAIRPWLGLSPSDHTQVWAVTTDCEYCCSPISESTLHTIHKPLPKSDLTAFYRHGVAAIREIINEVEDFIPEEYYAPDEDTSLSLEDAIMATVQYLIDVHWNKGIQTMDSQGGHVVRAAGLNIMEAWEGSSHKSILGAEHLKTQDVETIMQSCIPLVADYIRMSFPSLSETQIGPYLGTIPATTHPWCTLLEEFNKVGILRDIQTYMARTLRKPLHAYENHLTFSAIFAQQCCQLWRPRVRNVLRLAYLSNHSFLDAPSGFKRRLDSIRNLAMKNYFADFRRLRDADANMRLGMRLICAIVRYRELYNYLEFSFDDNGVAQPLTIGCITGEEDFDLITLVLDLIDSRNDDDFLQFFTRFLPNVDWERLYTVILEQIDPDYPDPYIMLEEEDEVIRNELDFPVAIIIKVDVLNCKETLRQHRGSTIPHALQYHADDVEIPRLPGNTRGRSLVIRAFDVVECTSYMPNLPGLEIDNNEEWDDTLFNRRWLTRPIGSGNISMSKTAHILDQCNITDLRGHHVLVTLADGYAGGARVLDQIVEDSLIIFVTSPNTALSAPVPPEELLDPRRNNRFDTYNMRVDRWDLADSSNYVSLELTHNNLITIVTNDVEIIGENQSRIYLKIWRLTCLYMIRNTRPFGILIMKVYLQHIAEIAACLALIRPYVCYLKLVISNASPTNGEAYLVAQFQRLEMIDYDTPVSYPPARVLQSLISWRNHYHDRLIEDRGGTNTLQVMPRYSPRIRHFAHRLPSYGWSMLGQFVRATPELVWTKKRHNESLSAFRQRVLGYLQECVDPLHHTLSRERHIDRRQIRNMYSTASNILLTMCHAFCLEGFMYIFRSVDDNIVVNVDEMIAFYNRHSQAWVPIWPDLQQPRDVMIAGHFKILDKFQPWRSMILGLRWGISAYLWGAIQ